WQPPPDQHLPSSYIFSLLVSRDGTLWIGTFSGLASWKDGKLTEYAELDGQTILKLLEDYEGTVWASGRTATDGRLWAIRHETVECYGRDGTLGRGAFDLYEDSKGNLWAGVKDGVWRWKPGPPRFYPLPGEPDGIQAWLKTVTARWWLAGTGESNVSPMGKPNRIRSLALWSGFMSIGCSATATAVCGLEPRAAALYIYTGEGPMCLGSLRASQADLPLLSLRIKKAIS